MLKISYDESEAMVPVNEYLYPVDCVLDKDDTTILNHQLKLFCFPDVKAFPKKSLKEEEKMFSFVLTSVDGGRRWAYCWREVVLRKCCMCFCYITNLSYSLMFESILKETYNIFNEYGMDDMALFLDMVYEKSAPQPGQNFSIDFMDKTIYFRRPPIEKCVFGFDRIDVLFNQVQPLDVLSLLLCLLSERRMIFFASNLSVLSNCIQGLIALLNPFSWQNVYIPVLPPSMLDFACAPMPFILGVLDLYGEEVFSMPLEEVYFVDLDEGTIFPPPDDYIHLNFTDVSRLLSKFQNVKQLTTRTFYDAPTANSLEPALYTFYRNLLGDYRNHFTSNLAEYDSDSYLNSILEHGLKECMSTITQCQSFQMFLNERMDNGFDNPFDKFSIIDEVISGRVYFKEGWLQKISRDSLHRWLDRYFSLSPRLLVYSKRHKDHDNVVGVIKLENIKSCIVTDSILEIVTNESAVQLKHDDLTEVESWRIAIQYLIDNIHKSPTETVPSVPKKKNVKAVGTKFLKRLKNSGTSDHNKIDSPVRSESTTETHTTNENFEFTQDTPDIGTTTNDKIVRTHSQTVRLYKKRESCLPEIPMNLRMQARRKRKQLPLPPVDASTVSGLNKGERILTRSLSVKEFVAKVNTLDETPNPAMTRPMPEIPKRMPSIRDRINLLTSSSTQVKSTNESDQKNSNTNTADQKGYSTPTRQRSTQSNVAKLPSTKTELDNPEPTTTLSIQERIKLAESRDETL